MWRVKNLLLVPSFAFPPAAIIKRKPLSSTARRAGWVGCNIALNRVPAEARIWLVTTSPSPPQSGGEGRGEVARIKSPLSGSLPAQSRGESVVVATPSEVREKFRRVKPLKEISVTQRGWTLDVLNIVRRLTEEKRQRAGALQDASRHLRVVVPRASVLDCGGPPPLSDSPEFTTADAYAFERELAELHPDNDHVKDKIRQQLQVLRDAGLLVHLGRGEWRLP